MVPSRKKCQVFITVKWINSVLDLYHATIILRNVKRRNNNSDSSMETSQNIMLTERISLTVQFHL